MSECGKDLNLQYNLSLYVNGALKNSGVEIKEDRSKVNQNGIVSFEVTGMSDIPSLYQNSDINIRFDITNASFTNKREIHGTDIDIAVHEGRFILGGDLVYNEGGYFKNIGPGSSFSDPISIANINTLRESSAVFLSETGTLQQTNLVGSFWFSLDGGWNAKFYMVNPTYKDDATRYNDWKAKKNKQKGCYQGREVKTINFIDKEMSKFPVKPKDNLTRFVGTAINPNIKYTDIKGVRNDTYKGKFGATKNGQRETKEKVIRFRSIQLNNNKLYTFNTALNNITKQSGFQGEYYDRLFTPTARAMWKTGNNEKIDCLNFTKFYYNTYRYAIGRNAMDLSYDFIYDSVDYVSCISEYQYENTEVKLHNYEPYTPSLYATWADNIFSGKVNIYNQRLDMGGMEDLKINNNRVAQKGDIVTTYSTSSRHSMSEKWMKRNWLSASAASVNGFNYLQRKSNPNFRILLKDSKNKGTNIKEIRSMASGIHGLNFTRSNYLDEDENSNNFNYQLIPDNAKITRVVETDGLAFITNSSNNYIFVSKKGTGTNSLTALCVIDTGLTQNVNLNIGGCKSGYYHYVWFTYYNKCVNEQALVVIKKPASLFKSTNKNINQKMYNATEELSHIESQTSSQESIYNYYVEGSTLFGQEVYFGNDWLHIGYKRGSSEFVRAFRAP